MDAYIISYFGKGGALRRERQGLHYQQLCSLLQQPGIEDIHILAQAYDYKQPITKPEGYLELKHPRVHYHHTEQMTPAQARNRLIDIYYATRKPWALFADNDAAIDPRWHGRQACEIIDHNTVWLNQHVDILSPVSPRHQPFSKVATEREQKGQLDTHTPIKKENYIKTTLFFMKNRGLQGNKPIYFDETLRELEDYEYQGRVLQAGGTIYQLSSIIMADLGQSEKVSTLFEDQARTTNFAEVKERIYKRYFDPNTWQGVDNTKFRWEQINNNRALQMNYKLPLPGYEGVLDTQDNLYHTLFEVE